MQTPTPQRRSAILLGNTSQKEKSQHIQHILKALSARNFDISIEENFGAFLRNELHIDISHCQIATHPIHTDADFAISVGGDGTFLHTAATIGPRHIPILGINTGHLGFLADVAPDDIDVAVEALCCGKYTIEEHSVLQVTGEGDLAFDEPYALNEVSVLKTDSASLIHIYTSINEQEFTTYVADGLIISTPTGSTGYSLSAGGPIIATDSHSFCLTPIAPHSLSIRPFIINDDAKIKLTVKSRTQNFLISIDGRSKSVPVDTAICISRATHTIKVVKIRHRNFFDTLKDKLHWGIDGR
ncbi:MAG: NAD kinase [Alloprevotella sp.]|nr:NAD kinase [Alloprevotella sp.]